MGTEFKENHSTHLNPLSFKSLTHYVTVLTGDPRFTIAEPQLDPVSSHGLQSHSCLYKASDKQMGTPLLHILSSPILLFSCAEDVFSPKRASMPLEVRLREKRITHQSPTNSSKYMTLICPPHIHNCDCKLKNIPA
jgi:hypothetical protein